MSAPTTTAEEHLASIAQECAGYYDEDDMPSAIACFASRVKDHPGTAHLAKDTPLIFVTFQGGWIMGRQGVIDAVNAFAV